MTNKENFSLSELLAGFGIANDTEDNEPKLYKFTSKITGKSVDIELLPDDIIVDGELRRIIRDETGEIPNFCLPSKGNPGYIRITADCKCYSRIGKQLILRNNIYHIGGNYIPLRGKCHSKYSFIYFLAHSFISNSEIETVNIPFETHNGIDASKNIDITVLITKIKDLKEVTERSVVGIGKVVKASTKIEGNVKKSYYIWRSMLYRCYTALEDKYQTYRDCSVNKEWHTFDNFDDWFSTNIYKIQSGVLELDKDIAVIENRVYSAENCILVPSYINCYVRNKIIKNSGLPMGVKLKAAGRFEASCSKFLIANRDRYIGTFDTPEEAHQAWADFKNKQLQEVVIPYFIEDVFEEDRQHPMVLKAIEALRNFKFK